MFFTYTVLIHMPVMPSWQEWFVIAYLFTLCIEKVREVSTSHLFDLVSIRITVLYTNLQILIDNELAGDPL